MLGRRWKQTGNSRRNPECPRYLGLPDSPESSSSDSSPMPPRAKQPIYTTSETLILGPWESLGRADGSRDDFDYYFVQCRENPQPLEYYYRDLSGVYGGPDGTSDREPYNQERLDKMFFIAPGTKYSYARLQARLGYANAQIDDALKSTLHFGDGYE